MDADKAKIKTRGFDFVMYQTKDMKKLRAFYEELLDIKPGQIDSEYFVEYDLGDGNAFAIGHDPSSDFVESSGIVFGVDDAEAAKERLIALGGTFLRSYGGDHCTAAWCRDPDGNYIGFHQRK